MRKMTSKQPLTKQDTEVILFFKRLTLLANIPFKLFIQLYRD